MPNSKNQTITTKLNASAARNTISFAQTESSEQTSSIACRLSSTASMNCVLLSSGKRGSWNRRGCWRRRLWVNLLTMRMKSMVEERSKPYAPSSQTCTPPNTKRPLKPSTPTTTCSTTAPSSALQSSRQNLQAHLTPYHRRQCAQMQGCCARGCGCCERPRNTTRAMGSWGHCTEECACCRRVHGEGLSISSREVFGEFDRENPDADVFGQLMDLYVWGKV